MNEPFVDSANALLALENHPVLIGIYVFLALAIIVMVFIVRFPQLFRRKNVKPEKAEIEKKPAPVPEVDETVLERRCEHRRQEDRNSMDNIVDGLSKQVEDLSVQVAEDIMRSCVALIYMPRVPIGYKLDAAISYFKRDGNGNVRDHIVAAILNEPNGIQHWRTALHRDTQHSDTEYSAYFQKTIEWIENKITGGQLIS